MFAVDGGPKLFVFLAIHIRRNSFSGAAEAQNAATPFIRSVFPKINFFSKNWSATGFGDRALLGLPAVDSNDRDLAAGAKESVPAAAI